MYQQNHEENENEDLIRNLQQNKDPAICFGPSSLDQNQDINNSNQIINPLETGFEIDSTTSTTITTSNNKNICKI